MRSRRRIVGCVLPHIISMEKSAIHEMERLFDYWRGKSIKYWLHRMMELELYDPAIR